LQVDSSIAVPDCSAWPETAAVLRQTPDAIWRLAGDRYVFVEFGDMVLDFALRARVAELEQWLASNAPEGFVESSPGVRSALLEYDPMKLPLPDMLKMLERCGRVPHVVQMLGHGISSLYAYDIHKPWKSLAGPLQTRALTRMTQADVQIVPSVDETQQATCIARPEPVLARREAAEAPDVSQLKVKSRVLHLPMAFRERWSQEAMAKYKASVRPDAAYLPDNAPFVAEINALAGGIEELKKIMFDASYMVFGLGDVYLGAPCAVPVNPLHRCGLAQIGDSGLLLIMCRGD
jgi:allophanate hydrolase subunit 1